MAKPKKPAAKKPAAKKPAAKKPPVAKKPAPKKAAAKTRARAKSAASPRAPGMPAGSQRLVTNLVYADAGAAITWYGKAFGATELMRMHGPDGKRIWHAELRFGDTVLFLSDESPMATTVAPHGPKTTTASLQLYVPDTDAATQAAVDAGARLIMPAGDMFWGDRMACVEDPFGHTWMIATRVKEMSHDEMREAGLAFAKTFAAS